MAPRGRVLGLIPARGGSKGIPRKNIRELAGRPLLAYTAEAALAAGCLDRVVLSTEDEAIARIAGGLQLEVPCLRPEHLARDETPTLPVVQHMVEVLEGAGDHFQAICLLQPTNPLRSAETIRRCVELLFSSGADAVVTVLPVPAEHHPHWVYLQGEEGDLSLSTGAAAPPPRRQDLSPAFHREGSVYVTRRDVVMNEGSLYGRRLLGVSLEGEPCVNLDTLADWEEAERLLADRAAAGGASSPP